MIVETADAYIEGVNKGRQRAARAHRWNPRARHEHPDQWRACAGWPSLIDQDGKHVTLETFRGSALAVTFTYTGCPMPDQCPLLDKRFSEVQSRIVADHNQLRVRLLTVTIDPTRDTATALKDYAAKMKADPAIWTMATGEQKVIDEWASRFGVSVSRAANNPSDITHNLRTALIDRQGNLVQTYSGTTWTPEQLLADVKVMVGLTDRLAFTPAERRLIARLRTPAAVQEFLNRLPYNQEPHGRATLRSFRGVVHHGVAHCLEAALFAAVVLEQHGYPARVLSFESIDHLDHVLFVYQHKGRWGSIARSRDPGLHGRLPKFATARALARSYMDAYVDYTGRIVGYAVVDLAREMGDLRVATGDNERVEGRADADRLPASQARELRCAVQSSCGSSIENSEPSHDDLKPFCYRGRDLWTPIPEDDALVYWVGAAQVHRCTCQSRSKSPRRFGDGLLARLAQGFLEPLRKRIAAVLLRVDRLLENRLAARRLVGEDPGRIAQLGLVATLGLDVRHHALQIDIDDQSRLAAGTGHFDL